MGRCCTSVPAMATADGSGTRQEWRAQRELSGGGELLDQGSHLIDLTRYLAGDVELAFSELRTEFWAMDVEDNAYLALRTAAAGSPGSTPAGRSGRTSSRTRSRCATRSSRSPVSVARTDRSGSRSTRWARRSARPTSRSGSGRPATTAGRSRSTTCSPRSTAGRRRRRHRRCRRRVPHHRRGVPPMIITRTPLAHLARRRRHRPALVLRAPRRRLPRRRGHLEVRVHRRAPQLRRRPDHQVLADRASAVAPATSSTRSCARRCR